MILILTGSWRLSRPPTSLELVIAIWLLTALMVVVDDEDDAVDVDEVCTGTSTTLFQLGCSVVKLAPPSFFFKYK